MLNDEPAPALAEPVSAPAPVKAPARGRQAKEKTAKAGVVDSGRGRRGKAPAARGKKGLKEI